MLPDCVPEGLGIVPGDLLAQPAKQRLDPSGVGIVYFGDHLEGVQATAGAPPVEGLVSLLAA